MILVDTSIWVDHLRVGHPVLAELLNRGSVLGHPWVAGEIALGSLSSRQVVVGLLSRLPQAEVATVAEVAGFIERFSLFGTGIGFVDAQLVAATRLTADARLWTRDRRLAAVADRVGLLADPT